MPDEENTVRFQALLPLDLYEALNTRALDDKLARGGVGRASMNEIVVAALAAHLGVKGSGKGAGPRKKKRS